MENKEFLTIKEFAARANITAQAVYKRLNNPKDELNSYLKLEDGKKMIDISALAIFLDDDNSTGCTTGLTTVEQQLIDMLQAEIEVKNKQIEQLQQLLSQEQQLRYVSDQRILQLEAHSEPPKKWWHFWK